MDANEVLIQLIKNRTDPIQWIKSNVTILHPGKGLVPFDLYDFQENIINIFLLKHFIITLKSRQIGMSTLVQAICLWAAMHYANYNVLILSSGQRNATSFLEKIREMYDNIPKSPLKLELTINNRQTLEFSNGAKISAVPATRKSSLGESINLLIIDEAANISNVEAVYQAAYPTLSRSFNSAKGKPYGVIIISTPNGISGDGKWYYEMYEGALREDNKYIPIKIHWSQVPEYDENWYIDQCKQCNWDYRIIASELELSFVSSGNTFIPGPLLDSVATTQPIVKDFDDKLWIWESPKPNIPYVMGVDVAYGDRKDSSTIQIINAVTLDQAAEFDSNVIKVSQFAEVITKLSRYYNNALINIERNAVGKVLIEKIIENTAGIGVNLYRDVNKNELESKIVNDPYKTNIGTLVTGQSRDIILGNMYNIFIDKYSEALNRMVSDEDSSLSAREKFEAIMGGKTTNAVKKNGIIKSERLLYQLLSFIVDDAGRPIGPKDDLIFGWSHAFYAYIKNKAFLLKNVASIISDVYELENKKDQKIQTIEFMKSFNDTDIWKDLSVENLQQILDEEEEDIARKNEEYNNKTKVNNDTNVVPITRVLKNFYNL